MNGLRPRDSYVVAVRVLTSFHDGTRPCLGMALFSFYDASEMAATHFFEWKNDM
jgi:hypothetical protein